MAEEFQERTEQATPKRREEARKKGKVAKSYEFNSAIVLIASLVVLYLGGRYAWIKISNFTIFLLSNLHSIEISEANLHRYATYVVSFLGLNFLPFLFLLLFVGIGANLAQTGFVFTFEPLKFDFERLNPVNGIKKILFSRRSFFELVKGFFKIGVVGLVAFMTLKSMFDDVVVLIDSDAKGIAEFIVSAGFSLLWKTAVVYLALAMFDFSFQRWEYERELKMTRQEVKEELKELEGDPLVKARIRKKQREIVRMRMMHSVAKADVVITNPTHIAVALKYEPRKMKAPKVVAKGMNLVAERIKKIAREKGIPIIEDKPLAQTLFKIVDVDEEIPPQLYKAVAKVLAYVFRLKNKSSKVLV